MTHSAYTTHSLFFSDVGERSGGLFRQHYQRPSAADQFSAFGQGYYLSFPRLCVAEHVSWSVVLSRFSISANEDFECSDSNSLASFHSGTTSVSGTTNSNTNLSSHRPRAAGYILREDELRNFIPSNERMIGEFLAFMPEESVQRMFQDLDTTKLGRGVDGVGVRDEYDGLSNLSQSCDSRHNKSESSSANSASSASSSKHSQRIGVSKSYSSHHTQSRIVDFRNVKEQFLVESRVVLKNMCEKFILQVLEDCISRGEETHQYKGAKNECALS